MTKKDEIGDFWDLDALIVDFNPQDLLIEDFTLDVAPTDLEIENLDFNLLGFCANSSPKKKKSWRKGESLQRPRVHNRRNRDLH